MKVSAIPPLVELAHSKQIVVVCDNTFASPYVMRPLDWGVDLVLESATKFIGGHSDAIVAKHHLEMKIAKSLGKDVKL